MDRRLWTAGGGTATRCMVRVPVCDQCMIACDITNCGAAFTTIYIPWFVRRVILASINNSSLVASSLLGLVAKRMGQVLRLRHAAAVHHCGQTEISCIAHTLLPEYAHGKHLRTRQRPRTCQPRHAPDGCEHHLLGMLTRVTTFKRRA